ncbi:MAG: SAF domain-containing protein [Nocardioides sp.]
MSRERLVRAQRAVRRGVLARRRLLAALSAAVAVAATLHTLRPPPAPIVTVLAARHDLAAGITLTGRDLVRRDLPTSAVPAGAALTARGRVLAAPMRSGETVTDVRLVGPALAAASDESALPVRMPDPAMVALLQVGDRIDLIGVDARGHGAALVAAGVRVLALPRVADDPTADGGLSGRLVVLSVPTSLVDAVSSAAVGRFLTFAYSR